MEFFSSCEAAERSHGTLVMPALSIGNAGQLAADLLISSWGAAREGFLDDPCVLPCVGNDPFGPEPDGKLTVALELYGVREKNLSILQQRSPFVKGATVKFSENIANWASEVGFDQIVILSGLDSGRRQTFHEPQVHYVSSSNEDGTDARCESLGWTKLEKLPVSSSPSELTARSQPVEGQEEFSYLRSLPATALMSSFKSKGLNVLCLFCYCAEGDNVPDAFFLANALDRLLKNADEAPGSSWRVPLSWSTVYGPPPDQSMY